VEGKAIQKEAKKALERGSRSKWKRGRASAVALKRKACSRVQKVMPNPRK